MRDAVRATHSDSEWPIRGPLDRQGSSRASSTASRTSRENRVQPVNSPQAESFFSAAMMESEWVAVSIFASARL